ncbi:MAG: peptide deformylase [Campylobacterota bacterium]|nr:peptide deformylase [Campylobacterota bacterium]
MIKNIITYPTPTGIEYAPDVRVFDKELCAFIDDLKETAEANSLDGLSASQVGSYYNVVVVKQNGDFLELINPRILSKKGNIDTVESSSYFPNITANMKRYETINLVYEDRVGEQHSLKANGEFAILLQRKIDYLFGANFLTQLKDEEKEKFELALSNSGVSCPTPPRGFNRDYFVKSSNYIMIAMILLLASSFIVDNSSLWDYQFYASLSVIGVNIAYFCYSYYENKKYNICTNCFNMSIYGVIGITLFRLSMIVLASWFIL